MSDPNEKDPLARFLVTAPLYRQTEIAGADLEFFSQSGFLYIKFPRTVRRECISCGAMMSWDIGSNRNAQNEVLTTVTYTCRNCHGTFRVWIEWKEPLSRTIQLDDKVVFEKCGQSPKFEINPPKNLEKSLGRYVGFWRTGMTLRHHGYGLGALVYFRRIVEGMTKALLGMLADAMEASGDEQQAVTDVRNLVEARRPFEEKMELAAKMIPQHLRPGGANPLQTIFEIVSGGIHADTDEACCDLVDTLAEGMALLFANLNTHIEQRKSFREAAKKIEGLRTEK
jgi:hypothetical protein